MNVSVIDRRPLNRCCCGELVRAFGGDVYSVEKVNDCRALLKPMKRQQRVVVDRLHDTTVAFEALGRPINVAPTSVMDVVRVAGDRAGDAPSRRTFKAGGLRCLVEKALVAGPMDSAAILAAVLAAGWTTAGKTPLATVQACLSVGCEAMVFERVGRGVYRRRES